MERLQGHDTVGIGGTPIERHGTIDAPARTATCIDAAAAGRRARARDWWGLAVLTLPCLLYSMDLTVLHLAVPHLVADLRPDATQLLWIVDIYGFMVAGSLITMGAIGDRIGRRRLLMLGAAAFGLASILAACAGTAGMLITARGLLGLAAATLAPSTLSLIRTMFADDRQRSIAIGIWMAAFSVGGAIGPLVGGALLDHFRWGSVFLIAVPVMILLLAVGPVILPEGRDTGRAPVDLASAGLSIAALLALVYGIKHLAIGSAGPMAVVMLAAGLALALAFLRRQRRLVRPMIDPALFAGRRFTVALALNLTAFFLTFGTLLFLAQRLQLVVGLGAFQAGLWTLVSAGGFTVGSLLGPAMLRVSAPAGIITTGFGLAALGFGLAALALARSDFALLMIASFCLSLGLAPVFALSTDLIVGSVPERQAGAAAAIAETSSELGGALGIAILGSVVAGSYRRHVDRLLPDGLPVEVAQAARDGIGTAIDVAALGAGKAHPVVDAARQAFDGAFTTVAWISMAIALAAAVIAAIDPAWRLRRTVV